MSTRFVPEGHMDFSSSEDSALSADSALSEDSALSDDSALSEDCPSDGEKSVSEFELLLVLRFFGNNFRFLPFFPGAQPMNK